MGRGVSKIGGSAGGSTAAAPAPAPTMGGKPKSAGDLSQLTVGQAMQLTDSDLMGIKGAYGINSKYRDDGTLNYATVKTQEAVKNVDLTQESAGDRDYAVSQFQQWMKDVNDESVSKADIDVDSNGITRWLSNGDKQFFSVDAMRKSEVYIEPNTRHGKTLSSKVYVDTRDKGLDSFSFKFVGSKAY